VKRKFNWLPPVFVAVALLGYLVGWPWYRDRPARAAADALIADLAEHGGHVEQRVGSLPAIPERPAKADLEALLAGLAAELKEVNKRSQDLVERAEEVLPRTPADKREELRQALDRYTAQGFAMLAPFFES
jgi:hypothetical protein